MTVNQRNASRVWKFQTGTRPAWSCTFCVSVAASRQHDAGVICATLWQQRSRSRASSLPLCGDHFRLLQAASTTILSSGPESTGTSSVKFLECLQNGFSFGGVMVMMLLGRLVEGRGRGGCFGRWRCLLGWFLYCVVRGGGGCWAGGRASLADVSPHSAQSRLATKTRVLLYSRTSFGPYRQDSVSWQNPSMCLIRIHC